MTLAQYLEWFDEVVSPTATMFRLVPPENLDWMATPDSFTLGQLLNHITRSLWFNTKIIKKEDLPLKSMREILLANRRQASSSVAEALDLLERSVNQFRSAVADLGEERFQNEIVDTPQKGKVPQWRICVFAMEHHIHHLMELHISLKMLGAKVNTGTLYRG